MWLPRLPDTTAWLPHLANRPIVMSGLGKYCSKWCRCKPKLPGFLLNMAFVTRDALEHKVESRENLFILSEICIFHWDTPEHCNIWPPIDRCLRGGTANDVTMYGDTALNTLEQTPHLTAFKRSRQVSQFTTPHFPVPAETSRVINFLSFPLVMLSSLCRSHLQSQFAVFVRLTVPFLSFFYSHPLVFLILSGNLRLFYGACFFCFF